MKSFMICVMALSMTLMTGCIGCSDSDELKIKTLRAEKAEAEAAKAEAAWQQKLKKITEKAAEKAVKEAKIAPPAPPSQEEREMKFAEMAANSSCGEADVNLETLGGRALFGRVASKNMELQIEIARNEGEANLAKVNADHAARMAELGFTQEMTKVKDTRKATKAEQEETRKATAEAEAKAEAKAKVAAKEAEKRAEETAKRDAKKVSATSRELKRIEALQAQISATQRSLETTVRAQRAPHVPPEILAMRQEIKELKRELVEVRKTGIVVTPENQQQCTGPNYGGIRQGRFWQN
jgi:hypothetical protein